MNYFVLMLVLILGFVLGFILGFLLLISQLKKDQKIRKPNDIDEEEKEDNENNQEKVNNSFKERMLDMDDSWSDMNCSLDDIPKEEYIKENRGKQDKAYNYKK